jgi:aryl-alcohol dehydrogenase-like predicted oxidoreductase
LARPWTPASTSSTPPNVYGASPTFDRLGVPPAAEREPAEQILGRALAGRRDDVVLATKSGERRFGPAAGRSRRHVIQQVERSLRRLGTDYIDLYYAHFPDPDTPLEQTLSAYDDLVRQGVLRYVALSNYPAWQVTHAFGSLTTVALPHRYASRSSTTSSTAMRSASWPLPAYGSGRPWCRSLRCTAAYWPAARFTNKASAATSVSAGPASLTPNSTSAGPSSG